MVASRLHGIPPTIFAEMSALAVRTGSVNLGQGFPDEDGPETVVAAAVGALRAGANQYAPGIGVPALRRAIADHQLRHYGLELDPDTQVAVTTGCTEAVAAALLGLVEPGDEVVVLEPYYDSYLAMLQMAGGVRRPVTLRSPDFRVDLDELRAAVTPRTRFVLLNSPHNPTGTVLTRTEVEAVAALALEHDLTVITDEVYEHLVYDGSEHVPVATLPGMAERTLTLSSVGKSYSLTGWKVGWATGPAHLVSAVVAAKQWLTFTSGAPLQPAVAVALADHPDWPTALARDLQDKRDLLVSGLVAAGLPTSTPQGTYFATSDVSGLGWDDGLAFCLALPERAGVVAIPAQVFYDDPRGPGRHLVRWAFCKKRDVLAEATSRLGAADLGR
ncbi:pyridoxal phosphate-dependent aminotransferase [Nocardioides sp.]|uniref:pyridoxal phosphate-dependent aminotransferase n=1 Tax=Nocardioides sp. TaxID=35761 RepID=UPI00271A59E5|nr:pyridoxal phosphate-dependent aminotransferase [Nocardioides sp.]MDO9458030.1 pyridoxal phosphate-dependent aminotransferase [Nocardioides sp.]